MNQPETSENTAPRPVIYIVPVVLHPDAKLRRDELTAEGYCINGKSHGLATHGRLCAWCRAVHSRGVLSVLADPEAPPRPEGYTYRQRGDQRAVTPS